MLGEHSTIKPHPQPSSLPEACSEHKPAPAPVHTQPAVLYTCCNVKTRNSKSERHCDTVR
jgi:hypothetical protein